jgi:16S rRNA (cytosine967-C5)-methyltransferase
MRRRKAAVEILTRWEKSDKFINHILQRTFKEQYFSEDDRRIITEMVLGTIRWLGHLDFLLGRKFHGDYHKIQPGLNSVLRLGLYQMLKMDSVPTYAAVNESVELARNWISPNSAPLTNGLLRSCEEYVSRIPWEEFDLEPINLLSAKYSFPHWLTRRWYHEFGEKESENLMEKMNKQPVVSFRLNLLKTTPEQMENSLKKDGIEIKFFSLVQNFFTTIFTQKVLHHPLFKEGYFTVQDQSTSFPVALIDPKPGETILDVCSAPGGKTVLLAEKGENEVYVAAYDKSEKRLELVRENMERLGIQNVILASADASVTQFPQSDKVLVDAPCSGTGVIHKRVDLRWRRTENDIEKLSKLQKSILQNVSHSVKAGGILVYSTCALEAEENYQVVDWFLHNHPEFQQEPAQNWVPEEVTDGQGNVFTLPHIHDMDGTFAVRFRKVS